MNIDENMAPPGYKAVAQTYTEKWPLGVESCEGCAFEDAPPTKDRFVCRHRPCSKFGRPDKLSVIFKKV